VAPLASAAKKVEERIGAGASRLAPARWRNWLKLNLLFSRGVSKERMQALTTRNVPQGQGSFLADCHLCSRAEAMSASQAMKQS
jgi:hypothetical protein